MKKRLIIVFSSFMLMFTILYVRIGVIVTDEKYISAANNQSSRTLEVAKTRGVVYDTNFYPLVNQSYEEVYSVFIRNDQVDKLVRGLTKEQEKQIRDLVAVGLPFVTTYPVNTDVLGVKKFYKQKRYSDNQMAKHIIGYTDGEQNGVMGVEKAYNSFLLKDSRKTTVSYMVDGYGKSLNVTPRVDIAPSVSSGVVLTIDKDIQKICEDIGSSYIKKGAIVVMDTNTGELLAVASFPDFDINNLQKSIQDKEDYPLVNKAFSSYTLGSTFKLVTSITALEQGISPSMAYTCEGKIKVAGNIINCHDHKGHGLVNMEQALSVSCNPYFIDLALKCSKEKLYETASRLSFGRGYELMTGVWTDRGNLPRIYKSNNAGDIANFAFGQGDLLGTPIQVTQMITAIANGGKLVAPSIFKGYTQNGKEISESTKKIAPQKVVSKDVAKILQDFLITAVMDTENQKSKPNNVTAGGKTATAQTGMFYEDGEEKVNAWFTGFLPAQNPKYSVTILAEEGRTGNSSASPVFKEIADLIYYK